jgi:hypothetical protein
VEKAVLSYIKERQPVVAIGRVYAPESLKGAMLYDANLGAWWDATGEYSQAALNSFVNAGVGGY